METLRLEWMSRATDDPGHGRERVSVRLTGYGYEDLLVRRVKGVVEAVRFAQGWAEDRGMRAEIKAVEVDAAQRRDQAGHVNWLVFTLCEVECRKLPRRALYRPPAPEISQPHE